MKILISGTSGHLGFELANIFLQRQHQVYGLCESPDGIAHRDYLSLYLDFLNPTDECLKDIAGQGFDIVILNAMHAKAVNFVDQDKVEIQQMVGKITTFPILITQFLLKNNGSPCLFVFLNSETTLVPKPGLAVYAGSKMALTSFSKTLSVEFRDTGFSFVQLVLGLIDVPAYRDSYLKNAVDRNIGVQDYLKEVISRRFPSYSNSNLIHPQLIVETIEFLFAHSLNFSGGTLRIDNGIVPYSI